MINKNYLKSSVVVAAVGILFLMLPKNTIAATQMGSGTYQNDPNFTWITEDTDNDGVADKAIFSGTGDMPNKTIHGLEYSDRNIKTVEFKPGITKIAEYICSNGAVERIIIPSTVVEIGRSAFSRCDNLGKVEIPNGVKIIGQGAFDRSKMSEVSLPETLVKIDEDAFAECTELKEITIPKGVTTIGKDAFKDCINLSKVTVLSNSDDISYNCAFMGCKMITSIGPSDSTCDLKYSFINKIPDEFFSKNNNIKTVIIKDGISIIGKKAFAACESLENITIPNTVQVIDDYAFNNCTSISSITIPLSVNKIGDGAFMSCKMSDVTVLPYNVQYGTDVFTYAWINTNLHGYDGSTTEAYVPTYRKLVFVSLGAKPSVSPSTTPSPSKAPSISPSPSTTPSTSPSKAPSITPSPSMSPSASITPSSSTEPSEKPVPTQIPGPTEKPVPTETPSGSLEEAMATIIPDGPDNWKDKEGSEGFVYRLYNVALTRDAEEAGLNDWNSSLTSKSKTAAEVAQGIFFSSEYQEKNYTDAQYIKFMYRTMFGREADEGGMKNWLEKLENGMSREYVFRGFAESSEFTNLCDGYNIERGTVTLGNYRDKNEGATAFVARLYTKMLGRKFEENGIEDWTRRYLTGEVTIEDIATNGFLHSEEFTNLGLSNEDFVTRMYQTFLNREPDESGYNDWVAKLNKGERTRDDLVFGFSQSQEFANIKAQYGL